jgi:hypothetical protein
MSDNKGVLVIFLVFTVVVVGFALIAPRIMFPDPEKLVDEKKEILEEKFSQINRVCNEVTGGFLPEKPIEKTPEKLWLIDIYFRQDPGAVDYNTALLPVEFCRGYRDLKDDSLYIGHARAYVIAADAFIRKNAKKYEDSSDDLKMGIHAIEKTGYILFYRNRHVVSPWYSPRESLLKAGQYRGEFYLFRLSDAAYYGSVEISASNPSDISFPERSGSGSADLQGSDYFKKVMDETMTEFRIVIDDAIEKAVPLNSYNPILGNRGQ